MKLAVIDGETSGLNFGNNGDGSDSDEILEFCVKIWDDGTITRAYCAKFYATGPIHPKALEVNGYDVNKWQAAGAMHWNSNAAKVFGDMIAECDMLLGANTRFDVDVLKSSFRKVRAEYPEKTHRIIDVESMAAPLLIAGKIEKPSLECIAAYFGLKRSGQFHGAEEDVDITIAVFEKLFALYWPVIGAEVAA